MGACRTVVLMEDAPSMLAGRFVPTGDGGFGDAATAGEGEGCSSDWFEAEVGSGSCTVPSEETPDVGAAVEPDVGGCVGG